MDSAGRHRVVVVGGGFGGIAAVKALRRAPVEITLVDRRNFHLFQPLLYQVATGGLSPGNIAAPLRSIFSRQANVHVRLGEVVNFDLHSQQVQLEDETLVPFDSLIVAAGARTGYFGRDEWAEHAPGLKTIEDALEIRARVLTAFETAEQLPDREARRPWMTFVIVGGGPTGVELAGTLAEIAHYTLAHDFRNINPAETHIVLVDASDRILSNYATDLALSAQEKLRKIGVQVRSETRILGVDRDGVDIVAAGENSRIDAKTVLWAAGVAASPLGKLLVQAAASPAMPTVGSAPAAPVAPDQTSASSAVNGGSMVASVDRAGRVIVAPDLTVPGYPQVFVIGDLASCKLANGQPVPGVAPAAMQQGKYVADLIKRRMRGEGSQPFEYFDMGSMATIGRRAAIADIHGWKFRGIIAWLMWLFIHLIQLVSFESRMLVLIQWAWNYMTFSRSARLITESGYRHSEERQGAAMPLDGTSTAASGRNGTPRASTTSAGTTSAGTTPAAAT